ncbi:MAG: PDZ domain-containing protein [Afipia sp.]|nr:PDZ domain-containing protein [Afipia sp.]
MQKRSLYAMMALITVLILSVNAVVAAQDLLPAAQIESDEGGVAVVNGTMTITNPNIRDITVQPIILLEDQGGFVTRDVEFTFPVESQAFAAITNNFYTDNVITFEMTLPGAPQGTLHDVDNDGESDTGVEVYTIAFWDNRFGDPFITERDGYSWSTAYATTRASVDPDTLYEINGGQYLVYAPDDAQGFPSSFGDDGLLFTEDDPTVSIPAGWTIVNMDVEPFTYDRSHEVTVELHEPEELQPEDYSDMTYTEAFNAFIDLAKNEYAFTELKNIDWEMLRAKYLPDVEQAEADSNLDAFILALDSLTRDVPDGHWQFPQMPSSVLDDHFFESTSGGYGMSLRELSDGNVVVVYLTPGGPADTAGIEIGADILEFGGQPIEDAISAVVPFAGVGSPDGYRYQQVRYMTRAPLGSETEVTFQNPIGEPETVTLQTSDERDSFSFGSVYRGFDNLAPPLTYEFLDSGYGYVKISSFNGNEPVMIETWDYFMTLVPQLGVQGIILDLRQNGGGFSQIGDRIAGYFFNEEFVAGNRQSYNPVSGEFFGDPNFPTRIFPPEDPDLYFAGPVVVLVGPGCASACEFFTFDMIQQDRATIVGQYSSAGLGGGWEEVYLPDGLSIALPVNRPVDNEGNVIIEDTGIVPDVRVPVTEESVVTGQDIVLDYGVRVLDEALGVVGGGDAPAVEITYVDGGEIAIDSMVEGEIAAGERVRYVFAPDADATVDISLSDAEGALDTYLRIYDENDTQITENDDIRLGEQINSLVTGLQVMAGQPIIIEVATYDDVLNGTYVLKVSAAE